MFSSLKAFRRQAILNTQLNWFKSCFIICHQRKTCILSMWPSWFVGKYEKSMWSEGRKADKAARTLRGLLILCPKQQDLWISNMVDTFLSEIQVLYFFLIVLSRALIGWVDKFRSYAYMYVLSIGDFRVAFRLCFKASPSTKPFIWKLVLFTCKWTKICVWIKLISIWKASH